MDNEYKTVVTVSSDGDSSGVDKVTGSLKELRGESATASGELGRSGGAAKAAASETEAAARAVRGFGDAAGRSAGDASRAFEGFSTSCRRSMKDMVQSINQWITGFGIVGALSKLWGYYGKFKQMADEARESAVAAAVAAADAASDDRIRKIEAMADAQKAVADQLHRQADAARAIAQARAADEDAAFGERVAEIDLEEQEALAAAAPGDDAARARIRFERAALRRKAEHERREAAAGAAASQAAEDERTAGAAAAGAREDREAVSARLAAADGDIAKIRAFLSDPHAQSLAGQRAWRDSGGAGGMAGLSNAVGAARAAAESKLTGRRPGGGGPAEGGLLGERGRLAKMLAEADARIPTAEAAHEAASVRSGTSARALAALRTTGPAAQLAAARIDYQGVQDAERRQADEDRAKRAEAAREAKKRAQIESAPAIDLAAKARERAEADARRALEDLKGRGDAAKGAAEFNLFRAKGAARPADREAFTRDAEEQNALFRQIAADIRALSETIRSDLAPAAAEARRRADKAAAAVKAAAADDYAP